MAFGDSYTFVLGDHGRTNFSFIGDVHNLGFNSSTLLANRIIQTQVILIPDRKHQKVTETAKTGTANGGPNWVEYLTGCGIEPGFTSPLSCDKQLWDFAFAGADISEEL